MGTVLRTVESSDISVISEQGMLAYKDSKVPADLRNVKFNTCQKLPVWSHFERRNHRMIRKRMIPSSQLAGTQPPSWYVQSHLCWFPELPGGFSEKTKKDIQKRMGRLPVEKFWRLVTMNIMNLTKHKDSRSGLYCFFIFLAYHNFYASPMCNFFWYEVSEKTPRPVEKLPRGLEGRYQITLRDSVA